MKKTKITIHLNAYCIVIASETLMTKNIPEKQNTTTQVLRSRQAAGLSSQQCTISKVVHIEKSGVRSEPSQTKHKYLHVALCVVTDHASMDRGLRRNFFRGFYGFFAGEVVGNERNSFPQPFSTFSWGDFHDQNSVGNDHNKKEDGQLFDIVFAVIHFISCCPISSVSSFSFGQRSKLPNGGIFNKMENVKVIIFFIEFIAL